MAGRPGALWQKTLYALALCLGMGISSAWALAPEEVLVIANKNAGSSVGLARYYMEKRLIPHENLVLIGMTDKETCTREAYETRAVPPILRAIESRPGIRALVTIYGVPLRVSSPGYSHKEQQDLEQLQAEKKEIESRLDKTDDSDTQKAFKSSLDKLNTRINRFKQRLDKVAAFDSELSLVKGEKYDLNFWQPNPFFLGFKDSNPKFPKSQVMIVSRLDGATPKTVKRIIKDSMEAEKLGLKGTAYFDARWKAPEKEKKVQGYQLYDLSIHNTARFHSEKKILPVVLNDDPDLFKTGECPDAALYCGWYSLAHYVDSFEWAKGSVGFHIASSECSTLKNETSQVWCKKMLDNGIAATIGPVGEPYVQSFPLPEIFFNLLTEGYLTLAEAYMVSLPYLSWKMVLVGDPLYRVNIKGYP